jgi:hypothetical protein
MPLPGLFDSMPYLAHMSGWDIFNRIKNYFITTVVRIFTGSNGFLIQPQAYAYTGDLIGLTLALASAAWVVVKSVDHSVHFTLGMAHQYRYGEIAPYSNLGLYDMLVTLVYMCWSVLVIILSFTLASQIWYMIAEREIGVVTEGSGGVALDEFQSAKLFVLSLMFGMMSVVGGYSIGETTDQLIAWFDNYSQTHPNEACNNGNTSNCDLDESAGTALGYDSLYHFLTIASSYLLFFAITLGGYIFSFVYASITEPAECDTFGTLSESDRN